jgi:hypothetical protein
VWASTRKWSRNQTAVTGGSSEPLCCGGQRGQEAPTRSRKIGGRSPPTTSRTSLSETCMSPGQTRLKDSRPPTTRDLRSSRRELQVEIASTFAADAPKGRLRNVEGGFSQRFPPSCRGPRFFTPFRTHTHRRWGSIGSRGVAADRDRRRGAVVRDPTVSTAGIRVRVRKPLRKG